MIYPPTQSPTPEARPPRVNREIVAVLMAMACISAFLVHYTRDSWCDQPVLGRFCLPALFDPEGEGKAADDAGDGDEGSALSRPGSLEGQPLAQPPTPEALASPTTAGIDPWTMESGIPTPSLGGSSVLIDPLAPGSAYPGPGGVGSGASPASSLAPTPFDLSAFVTPASSSSGLGSATPDYRGTSTAQAAQAGSTPTASGTAAAGSGGTATATATAGPTAYP